MSLQVYTASYKRQAARLMDVRRWPDAERFWAGQAKGIMKEVIAYVPPSMGKADLNAKKLGEGIVARDVSKLFIAVSEPPERELNMEGIHQQHRNHRGKVARHKGKSRHRVSEDALAAYLRDAKKDVGYLAGGFNAAAARVGYRPPAWIWRHQSPGSVVLRVSERGIHFRATNAVEYASRIGILERQIQKGINSQTAKLWRETEFLLLKSAAKAGFKTRS